MTTRDRARLFGIARVAFGAALAVAPRRSARLWLGDAADAPATQVAVRSLGARDAAIGLGVLLAVGRDTPVRGWLEAGVLSDAGDGLATIVAWRHLPRVGRVAVAAFAVGGALAGRRLAVEAGTG